MRHLSGFGKTSGPQTSAATRNPERAPALPRHREGWQELSGHWSGDRLQRVSVSKIRPGSRVCDARLSTVPTAIDLKAAHALRDHLQPRKAVPTTLTGHQFRPRGVGRVQEFQPQRQGHVQHTPCIGPRTGVHQSVGLRQTDSEGQPAQHLPDRVARTTGTRRTPGASQMTLATGAIKGLHAV